MPSRAKTKPPPAPGDLRIVQAFAATWGPMKKDDRLKTTKALSDFLARWNLLPGGTEVDDAALKRALNLRAGLWALILANSGAPLDEKAIARLDQAASAVAPFRLRFDPDGSGRFEIADGGADGALGRLGEIVVEAQRQDLWPRLKICANDVCRQVFFDTSSNQAARWCDRRCSNRIHGQIYRRRQRMDARRFRGEA